MKVGRFPPILHNLNLSAMQSLLQWLLAKLHKLAHRGHLPVVRLAPLDLLIQVQVDLVDQTQHGSAVDIMDIGAGPSAAGNPSAPSSNSWSWAIYSWQQISVGFPKILIFRVPRSSISCAWHSASYPWRYNPRFYGLSIPSPQLQYQLCRLYLPRLQNSQLPFLLLHQVQMALHPQVQVAMQVQVALHHHHHQW